MKKESFRRILIRIFWISLVFTIGFSWVYIRYAVPDRLNLVVNEEEVFHFALPPGVTFESDSEEVVLKNASEIPQGMIRIERPDSVSMYGKNEGSYRVGMKFLGLIRMKDIQVEVVDGSYAIPCGMPVGIYLKSKGVMVIGTGQVTNDTGNVVEPAYGLLKSGDYIQTVDGEDLEDKNDLVDAVSASDGMTLALGIRRDGRRIEVDMTPVLAEDGSYKLGAWVRDDTQGIGTLTYVDEQGKYGALGHGISDVDRAGLLDIQEGTLYKAQILAVSRGSRGNPGELAGMIRYDNSNVLGSIQENCKNGIYGQMDLSDAQKLSLVKMPVAHKQEIETGPALIRCSVDGHVKEYEAQIKRIDLNHEDSNKSFILQVTDEELLEKTGGVVQGMLVRYNVVKRGKTSIYKGLHDVVYAFY